MAKLNKAKVVFGLPVVNKIECKGVYIVKRTGAEE